ncbi:hypothetical protein AS202_06660 [Myroides odoratimimus]|uniref:Uncharacterized protein n=1 Tax=Myroides odoratimimus TaxID=76832 RepID=A0AAI8C4Q5_9FLAO|nr:hypothetical protein AS202_06660 [Myroides odoratimimus]
MHISSRKPLSGQANSKKTPRIPEEPQAQTQYTSINQYSVKNSVLHNKTKRATKVINSISSQKERKENKKTALFNNCNLREQLLIQDTNTKKGEYHENIRLLLYANSYCYINNLFYYLDMTF